MQQWARRYQELAQRRGAFHRRGRMRAYIFDGIKRFKMARVVAAMPKLLHISVFLFFAGVVDFLFPIYPAIAYATLGCIMAFTLPYAIFTVLPNIHFNCPYGTPLSSITWRIFQLSVIIYLQIILEIRKSFSRTWSLANQHAHESQWLKKWQQTLENQVKIRRQWFSQGLLRSVELSAYRADSTVVTNALAWTLTALDEDKEIEDFAARVPGFFNSRVVPDATSAVLSLMSHEPTADPILGSRLHDLLKTCLPETSILDERMRKNRLWACLNCLWHFGRAYNQPGIYVPLPLFFLNTLITGTTRRVQIEEDSGIRMMGRCFEALIVRKLAADLDSGIGTVKLAELACLSAILGTKSHDTAHYLRQPDTVALANMISLFEKIGTIPNAFPSGVLVVVQQTLDILSQPMSTSTTESAGLHFDQPIPIINGSNGTFESILLSRLHDLLNACQPATWSHRTEHTSHLHLYLRGLWYFGRAFNQPWIHLPSNVYMAILNSGVTHIQSHPDATIRVIGHCAMTLVVNKLAADIHARTLPVNDAELASLSSILDFECHDIGLCLTQPGIVELVNMAFLVLGYVDTSKASDVPLSSPDILRQTLSILSQALPAQENAEIRPDQVAVLSHISNLERTVVSRLHGLLQTCMSDASPLAEEVRTSCLRMCLKILWLSSKAYHRIPDLLPYYIPFMLASPEMTHHFRAKQDPVVRLMGSCFGALIASKLVDTLDSESYVSLGPYDQGADWACISAILGEEYWDIPLRPHQLRVINFQNVISLILGEIDTLFTDTEGMLVDMVPGNTLLVDTTKTTLCILADRLGDRRFIPRLLPMYRRQLLQETDWDVEDAFGLHRSKRETVKALARLQQKLESLLPAVGPRIC